MNTTTTNISPLNQFDRLPDELLEKIFFSLNNPLPLAAKNHVRRGTTNSLYFDYSIQQPLLKQTHTELIQVSRVCRRFYKIIKSPHFWEQKGRQEHVLLPNLCLPPDFTAYEKLYVNNPFHPSFNLLEDSNWRKLKYTNSEIQLVPGGCHRLYDEFNRLSSCRATSYTLAQFFQRDVQLSCKGRESTDFVHLRPVIEFSVCIAARWDCGSQCSISLLFSDGHSWQCERTFPQWSDQKWHRLIYRYGEYQQFPSSVTVSLAGKDTQFWAGFYGIKFAQARLHLLLRTSENETNEESEVIIEQKTDVDVTEDPTPAWLPDDIPIDDNLTHSNQSESSLSTYYDTDEDEDADNNDD